MPGNERQPSLRGEGVLLRPLRRDDAERLEQILGEPEVSRWWVLHGTDAKRVARGFFDEEETVAYAIEAEGELIGLIQYHEEDDPDYRHAGIDIFVATAWQGRGLGREAIRILARHLFDERGHHRLTIDPAVANTRAIRAYERIGFRAVGVMRAYERDPGGIWRDGLLLDLLASEFRSS